MNVDFGMYRTKSTSESNLLHVQRSAEFHAISVTEALRVVVGLDNSDWFVWYAGGEIRNRYRSSDKHFAKNHSTIAEGVHESQPSGKIIDTVNMI